MPAAMPESGSRMMILPPSPPTSCAAASPGRTGSPLPVERGDPVRVGVPGHLMNSAILRPDDHAVLPSGPTTVMGYAYAGDDRRIARVDVSADGGRTWLQAELEEDLGLWAWRFWHAIVDLPVGDVTITARARDATAAVQPAHPESVWNPRGYIDNTWPAVTVSVHDVAAAHDDAEAGSGRAMAPGAHDS